MASEIKMKIPERYYPGFSLLSKISEDEFAKLETGLSKASPSVYRRGLVDSVVANSGLERDSVDEIIATLTSLYVLKTTRFHDNEKMVQDVVEALREDKKLALDLSGDKWTEFGNKLLRLLSYDRSIGLTSKAWDVMSEHQHIYCNSDTRIVTDIRPVFLDGQPLAGVIIHNLKICYHENQEHKEFYVALDTNDIRELRELLDKADSKAKHLREVIGKTGMSYLDADIH